MRRKKAADVLNRLAQGVAGAALLHSLGHRPGMAVQYFLPDFRIDSLVGEDMDFSLEERDKKKHACILPRFVEAVLMKRDECPRSDGFFSPVQPQKKLLEAGETNQQELAREKENQRDRHEPKDGSVEEKEGEDKRHEARDENSADEVCFRIVMASVNHHDDNLADRARFHVLNGPPELLFLGVIKK